MGSTKTWLLLVDHNFEAIGEPFWVHSSDDIAYLKKDVKKECENDLAHINAARLTVWRTKGDVINNKSTSERMAEILRSINVDDESTIEELSEDELVADLGLSVGEVLLVQLPAITIRDGGTSVERRPELKEFSRYDMILKTLGMSPSEGDNSTPYHEIQGDAAQAIYDGRRVRDGVSTRSPPIQIFHPVFSDFIRSINDPDVQPTADELIRVYDFMYFASEVGQSESGYSERVRGFLRSILACDIREETTPGSRVGLDGVITLQIGDARITPLVIELRRELGSDGCDPSTQVSLSMRHSWIRPSVKDIRDRCCCPTILIAAGGPWLSVLGGVFTDRFIVQRLTDMMWMGLSLKQEDERVYYNARVFVALRNCLVKLKTFYETVLEDTPPLVDNEPHPGSFPYPTSFIAGDGSTTRFRYLESLEEDAACVTYLAEIVDGTGATEHRVKVVVKFVARYGKEVHEFLASKSLAPTLRYCGPIPETELSGVLPGPALSAAPGLLRSRSNLMYMVVMDYIGAQRKTPPADARGQIETILTLLHSEGYVFGDLRRQNILFDADGKVKLIDFDWCGRYDMSICDDKLPDDLKDQIVKNKSRVQVGGETYAHYPLSMSTVGGMWAAGMEPLAQIRPIHDWEMLGKLSWE